jgi:hypothetical protein
MHPEGRPQTHPIQASPFPVSDLVPLRTSFDLRVSLVLTPSYGYTGAIVGGVVGGVVGLLAVALLGGAGFLLSCFCHELTCICSMVSHPQASAR